MGLLVTINFFHIEIYLVKHTAGRRFRRPSKRSFAERYIRNKKKGFFSIPFFRLLL